MMNVSILLRYQSRTGDYRLHSRLTNGRFFIAMCTAVQSEEKKRALPYSEIGTKNELGSSTKYTLFHYT